MVTALKLSKTSNGRFKKKTPSKGSPRIEVLRVSG
jgi:hypothetical protein